MTALADDRVLDYALRVLHGREPSIDLTERIVEAWERGERGVSLQDLDEPAVRVVEPAPRPRATTAKWPWLAAAAAVLVAGGVAAWFAGRESKPSILARADAPVLVLRAQTTANSSEFLAGDVIAAPDDASSTLTLAGGQRLICDAGAIVALRERASATEVELLRGSGSIRATGGSLVLDAGFVRAIAADGADLAFELSAAPRDPLSAATVERLRERRNQPAGIRFDVANGEAWLEHRGGRDRLVAGVEREVWNAVESGDADAGGEKKVRVFVDALLGLAPRELLERISSNEMQAYLASHPARWATLRDEAFARIGDSPRPAVVQRLIRFGLVDPTGEGLAFVRELWLARPEGFSDLEIAALAERGQFEFEREAAAMFADTERESTATMVLALFVRRGDARAAQELRRELDDAREPRNGDFLRTAYSGYVLAANGDSTAWKRAIDRLRPEFENDVRQRRFGPASAGLELLREFDLALTARRPVPLEKLFMRDPFASSAAPIADLDDLRKQLDELASRR